MSGGIARGVWASLLSSFAFAVMDASSKVLVQTMAPSFVIVMRTVLLLGVTLAWVLVTRRPGIFRTTAKGDMVLRSVAFGFTSLLVVISFKYISQAETMAIYFINPILAVPLAAVLLREPAGRWAIPAAILGFLGVLFVIQPTVGGAKLEYLIPLTAGISGAVHDVMSRKLRGHAAALTVMIYGLAATLFWGLVTADWSAFALPNARESGFIVLAAVSGFIANYFVIVSFQLVPASLSSPLRYMILAWAALIGYVVFGQLPNLGAWIGIGLILGAGMLAIASSLKPAPVVGDAL